MGRLRRPLRAATTRRRACGRPVKASLGWDAARLIARRDGEIAGGVQLLIRNIGRAGAVAFAPRVRCSNSDDPTLVSVLERAVMDFGRHHGIRYVQAPAARRRRGRRAGAAGARLDAERDRRRADIHRSGAHRRPDETLLAAMRKSTRKGIRKAAEAGLQVRVGGETDLDDVLPARAGDGEPAGLRPVPGALLRDDVA